MSPPLDPGEDDLDDEQEVYEVGTATSAQILGNTSSQPAEQIESRSLTPSQIPPRRQSLLPLAFDGEPHYADTSVALHERTSSNSSGRGLQPHSSPRKTSSPLPPAPQSELPALPPQPISQFASFDPAASDDHLRTQGMSNGSTSWLDTIDESGVSSDASVRSNSPTVYLRSRHIRDDSGGTEAEFDAALDAAVEAAYDQGFEPDQHAEANLHGPVKDDPISNVRRNIELAKQRVREAELEAQALSAKERDKRRIHEEALHGDFSAVDSHYEDYEAEEEERILEEMMDDFDFDVQSKSALPRQSGSSSFSGRTASSSVPSTFTTAGTPLSTLAEEDVLPPMNVQDSRKLPGLPPLQNLTPTSALPPPPLPPPTSSPPSIPLPTAPTAWSSVRERRLSGQKLKELVIETNNRLPTGAEAPRTMPTSMPLAHPTSPVLQNEPMTSIPSSWKAEEPKSAFSAERPPFASSESLPLQSPGGSGFTRTLSQESASGAATTQTSAATPLFTQDTALPSSKIKHPPPRPIKVTVPADGPSHTPSTPATAHPELRRTPTFASLATHATQSFFDTDIHSPTNLGFPNPSVPDPPMPLEACPQSFLLRPFWLMRCLYQTISHSRGAYITTRLFVPSDAWRVRNVKIKAMDEKISNCDLLTAALLKLAQVDMFDADAVLEEMQALEVILDQVQTVLTKKLGSEVGVQGAMGLFKMADNGSPMSDQPAGRSSSGGGKSYLSSWRKLRSKSSGMSSVPSNIGARDGSARDTMTLHSLPMTETPKASMTMNSMMQLQCSGPNATYMSSLARLFDAAQILGKNFPSSVISVFMSRLNVSLIAITLDQIARQVEDPGLRHSSQTLVGLELSTRHAAEFFGFYVCRFVLNDVGLMLDKFIKRSGEWIVS